MPPWTCPACDRRFGRKNQSHVCAPALTLDTYFAARPASERAIFNAVISHLETVGPVEVEAVTVGILVKRARTFAELRPKRDRVVLSVLLSRILTHPRIARVERLSGSRAAHFIDLRCAEDVDGAVCDWLTESYLASPI